MLVHFSCLVGLIFFGLKDLLNALVWVLRLGFENVVLSCLYDRHLGIGNLRLLGLLLLQRICRETNSA